MPNIIAFSTNTISAVDALNVHKNNLLSILIFFIIIYNIYIVHVYGDINKLVINFPSHEVKSSLSINLSLWNLSLS